MRPVRSLLVTAGASALAAALAFAAWEYAPALVGEAIPGWAGAFVLDFRFVVSLVAVVIVLSIAERVAGWVVSRFGRER
jgi:hypothetical protein